MTTEDLIKLRELAEAATPGPWIAGDDEDSDYFLVGPHDGDEIVYQPVVKLHAQNNAEYIAAANPAKVIKLLDALEALGREVEWLKASELSAHNIRLMENNTYLASRHDEAVGKLRLAEAERDTLRAELAELKPLAALGAEMHAMTTTVHTDSIPFKEQLQIVPSLWLECMKERDQARAELESKAAELESVWSLSKKADEENDTLRAELAAIRAQEPVDLNRLDPWVQGLGKAVLAELKSTQSQAARVPDAFPATKDAGLVADGWFVWDGRYEKQSYDVWVKGCDVVLGCWPNAGKMSATDGSGRQWSPSDVLAVRVSEFQGRFPKPPASPKLGGI